MPVSPPRSRLFAGLRLAAWIALGLAAGCGRGDRGPAGPRSSEKGLFEVRFGPEAEPPPLHAIHSWIVEIRRPGGEPVEGAHVRVAGGMPEHQHGLPTQPRVTRELGDGRYLVEGMKFSMAGRWVLELTISAGSVRAPLEDRVSFEWTLPP